MDFMKPRYRRASRALLMLALLGAGAHAFALDPAPPGINVVIIDETRRGAEKGVLYRYGIASRVSHLNKGPHADALRETLHDLSVQSVRLRLAVPTSCPAAANTLEPCASVRRIRDVELPDVIAAAKGSTLLVLWPEAAYFPQEHRYLAYVDVDVIRNGKAATGPFYLGYQDWECDGDCVLAAFEASAKELGAMVRYMLELGPSAQTLSVPVAWQGKPLATNVDKWANSCASKLDKDRVIREYGERFWLNDPSVRTLVSTAWRGCNIFAAK